MLYFTRWKALAVVLTALIVCLCAVPNFFPEETVKAWPKWAQRHIVLGLDLQGGSHILLEVDANSVKRTSSSRSATTSAACCARPRSATPACGARRERRGRISNPADFQRVAKLRELSQPSAASWARAPRRRDQRRRQQRGAAHGAAAAITERVRQSVEQSIQIVERRIKSSAPSSR